MFLTVVIFINSALNKEGSTSQTEIPVNSVVLDVENKTIYLEEIGDTYHLEAIVYPLNAYNKSVKFTSSNENVVSVTDEGVVTLLRLRNSSEEDVKITVETIDGGYKDTVKVIIPVYTDYTQLINDYINNLEVSLINLNKKLFNNIQIVISDEVKINSIVDDLNLSGLDIQFNWEIISGNDVLNVDYINPTTGEATFKPLTTGEAIIRFICNYDGEQIILKTTNVKVTLSDVLDIEYTGLNETYYQGESINNSNIIITINYRDSYGNLNTRTANYDKLPNYIPLTTLKEGTNSKQFVYEGYSFTFEYEVIKSNLWDLKIEGLKRNYLTTDNLLSLYVLVTIDDKEYKYNLYELESNVRTIDMKVSGEKELIVYHMGKEYKFYFNVISDECTIETTGLNNKYPVNSKILYDNIKFNLKYVNNDYYQDKVVTLTDYYSESALDTLFNNSIEGNKEIKLNINNKEVILNYEVVNEIVNVKDLDILSPIKDEYLVNDPFSLVVNPVYDGYTLPFNKNDIVILLDGIVVSENEVTSLSGIHTLEIRYGDYKLEKKIEILCKLTINYYFQRKILNTHNSKIY